ncbi:hypothetical protein PHLCEN_2v11431 [Hermanssonia centrifuga]|uniref:Cytochrome P450 n=1 Tax=Hermanssonia centrifuga TaxID=98765 RepID=A0A2R6NK85_9APHY|nr:hypothetical protein PHLCEN_2v11431 [Hermanssonia centrifuga]
MQLVVGLFIIAVLLAVILYPDRCIGVAARKDLSGPRGLPLVGNLLQIWPNRRRMIPLMEELGKKYGPLSTFTIPAWGRTIVINRPEWLAHVKQNDLKSYTRGSVAVSIFEQFPGHFTPVATEGAAWRASRKSIQPIFAVKSFQDHLVSAMDELDGTKSHFDKNISRLWAAIEALIAEHSDRKRSQDNLNEKTDFLTSLIQGHSEENPVFLRNIMVTLLFGGRDNTQNSISWAMYELSRHPQWLTRMRKEAMELDQAGGMPTFSNVSSYIVHLAVFYETLRLWPGLPKNARYAIVDDVLPAVPDLGLPEVPISKGTYVLWSDRIIMRDPTVYGEDAAEFNPGRHISPEGKFIKPSLPEFISFGAGPRYCPAATIVPYEWVCIWSALLRDFDFEALDLAERTVGDTLTNQMEKPFMVRVRLLDKQEQLEY